jgi:hypothetical protein
MREGRPRTVTLLGMAAFLVILLWGLWHGVIGPRVIEPVPGVPVGAEVSDAS